MTGFRMVDCMFGALAMMLPDKVTAAGDGGNTGISFGGITTYYTWLVDDRIAAAAPVCGGVGSIQKFIDHGTRSYHGIYWWIPDMLTKGDHGEFAAAALPRDSRRLFG